MTRQPATPAAPRTAAERAAFLDSVVAKYPMLRDVRGWLAVDDGTLGVDVELLANILFRFDIGCEGHGDRTRHQSSDHREDAEAIAAEYARLRGQREGRARDEPATHAPLPS